MSIDRARDLLGLFFQHITKPLQEHPGHFFFKVANAVPEDDTVVLGVRVEVLHGALMNDCGDKWKVLLEPFGLLYGLRSPVHELNPPEVLL